MPLLSTRHTLPLAALCTLALAACGDDMFGTDERMAGDGASSGTNADESTSSSTFESTDGSTSSSTSTATDGSTSSSTSTSPDETTSSSTSTSTDGSTSSSTSSDGSSGSSTSSSTDGSSTDGAGGTDGTGGTDGAGGTGTEIACQTDGSVLDDALIATAELVHTMKDSGAVGGGIDAVAIDRPVGAAADSRWSVESVEVRVAVLASDFGAFPDGVRLGVGVWRLDQPIPGVFVPTRVATREQLLSTSGLAWSDDKVPVGDTPALAFSCTTDESCGVADHRCVVGYDPMRPLDAACFAETAVKLTWWRFALDGLTDSVTQQSAEQYVVGVEWFDDDRPLVASSRFTFPCDRNWTDTRNGDGLHVVMEPDTAAMVPTSMRNACTAPLLKVATRLTTPGRCK